MARSRQSSSRPAGPQEHDLVGGDPHLTRITRTLEVCMCFGSCCVTLDMECICPECDCEQLQQAPATETPQIVDVPLPEEPKPEHACQDCGVEVFRNGTRGRYPSRCPECKEKR